MASSSGVLAFETGHDEMIHDAQMDYYGKRMATASSDRTIRVFEIIRDTHNHVASLQGHDGPVWQAAWAHPKFGSLIASCSHDGKVIVWKEESPNQWVKIFEDASHESSVNAVSWAPHAFGLMLATASADGTVSVFTYAQATKQWHQSRFNAHVGGVNAVSWGPDVASGALLSADGSALDSSSSSSSGGGLFTKRFVTGGCDNRVKIWHYNESTQQWAEQHVFVGGDNAHDDWVRDAAWAPSLGLPSNTVASASEDGSVIIWTETANGQWRKAERIVFGCKVWKCSWSVMGNVLAVSQGDNVVSLWKEGVDGKWTRLESLTDTDGGGGDQQQRAVE